MKSFFKSKHVDISFSFTLHCARKKPMLSICVAIAPPTELHKNEAISGPRRHKTAASRRKEVRGGEDGASTASPPPGRFDGVGGGQAEGSAGGSKRRTCKC